jgi:hypothetical protein
MRIVDELISFYRHIYLNLPGIIRLAGIALVLVVGGIPNSFVGGAVSQLVLSSLYHAHATVRCINLGQ